MNDPWAAPGPHSGAGGGSFTFRVSVSALTEPLSGDAWVLRERPRGGVQNTIAARQSLRSARVIQALHDRLIRVVGVIERARKHDSDRVVVARISDRTCLPSGRSPYNVGMNVDLTPDQRAIVKQAIESGRFSREEEAVRRRWRSGKSASADGWRSWRRLTRLKCRSRVARADRSRKNP